MQHIRKTFIALLLTALTLTLLSGCGTTRTENGVTIEEKGSYNPLNWFQ